MVAYYLKYRPQTLEELFGQTQVKSILQGAFSSEKLSHAYLFVGPRGTGKTSTARILAKMVNCSAKQNVPCNECETCLSITNGSNLDLIEIDAASNRGIDDIRVLRETIKLAPSGAKKKVYIIDEVHMLTTEAFNALLKTLEEPPSHAIFILATTEVQKVPATILSRVTRVDFKLASTEEIVEVLKKVSDGEKIKIETEALALIAKKAEGSFRDGVKLLDQLSSHKGEIKVSDVKELLSFGDFEIACGLLEKVSEKNSKEALILVVKQIGVGMQVKDFILFLEDLLRSLVFIKNDLGLQLVKEEVGNDKYQKMVELSDKFSIKDLVKALDSLQNAFEKMKIASIPSLPLELAMVEMCSDLTVDDRRLKIIAPSTIHTPSSNADISRLSDKWTFVLETVRQNNFSLEALLRGAKILECSNGVISIEVPYAFHQRILEQSKNKELLEAVVSDVLAEPMKIVTVLGSRPQRIEDIANVELAAEDEIITLASEIFNGKLVD